MDPTGGGVARPQRLREAAARRGESLCRSRLPNKRNWMPTQEQKAVAFRELHRRAETFLIPNPWDVGSARLLAHLGFKALATTSAGYAFSAGQRDHTVGRDQMLAHAGAIVAATDLPVSADLGNAFGDSPEAAAETFRLAVGTGLAGASIEDGTGRPGEPVYAHELAVERVRAVVEAARSNPFPFTVTARSENYLVGRPDLADTIRRLQAYQGAGADVLYAPGLTSREDIAAVVRSVDRPVNVLVGFQGAQLNLAELAEIGVKRVCVGSALARVAYGAFLRAAEEMRDQGTFTSAAAALSFRELSALF